MKLTADYFFKQPTLVPQASGLGNGVNPRVKTSDDGLLQNNIDLYEEQFYIELLGYDLASELIAAYEASVAETNPIPLEQKWIDLLAKLFNETKFRSPAANYVFWFIMEDIFRPSTRVGTVIGKKNEGIVTSPATKQITAWNLMVDELVRFYEWLETNRTTYEHDMVIVNPCMVKSNGCYIPSLTKTVNMFGI